MNDSFTVLGEQVALLLTLKLLGEFNPNARLVIDPYLKME